MRSWLKRIRGAIGVGLTWAAAWALFGGLRWWLIVDFQAAVSQGFSYAVAGFVGGATFAAVLRLAEGRRRFDELRIPRFAAWGGLGGLLIGAGYAGVMTILFPGPAPAATFGVFATITTLLGAVSAAGSLAIARFADDRRLLEEAVDTADVGLSPDERRKLFGDPDVTAN